MSTDNDVVKRQPGRRVLLLIAGIPLSMMLAATLLWWAVAEGQFDIVGAMGTANHGELIVPPKSLSHVYISVIPRHGPFYHSSAQFDCSTM